MSQLQVDTILNSNGDGSPDFPHGLTVTGIITATLLNQNVTGIITAGAGINAVGVITAGSGIDINGEIGLGAGVDNGTTGQVLTSGGSGASPSWSTIALNPEFIGIASGSLTGGRGVCVADDGKLLAVTGSNEAKGISTRIATNPVGEFCLVYDESADKYLYFYSDTSVASKGQVRVGTQSGTTITWGAAQQFTADQASQIHAIYDSANEKTVLLFRETGAGSNNGTVIVCSLSGSTLTLGTPVRDITEQSGGMEYSSFCYCSTTEHYALVYNNSSGNKGYCRLGKYSGTNSSTWPNGSVLFQNAQARGTGCCWDSTAERLIIMAHNGALGNHGYIVCGTISGDAVTFPSGVAFDANNADGGRYSCDHDPNTGITVLCYPGGSFIGKCKTATVSGNTFTFGAEATFNLGQTDMPIIRYGAGPKKFLVEYADGTSSYNAKSRILNITGTTITYGAAHTFQILPNAGTVLSSLTYNPDTQSFVSLFKSEENSVNQGTYYVQNIRVSNVTSGNYVGIANASYTNGQNASTALPGAVNSAVSGLTVGSKYYVIADGTLNTSADSENIDAGNAIAANKLLVR